MIEHIINPKQPTGPGWEQVQDAATLALLRKNVGAFATEIWYHRESRIQVFSAVEVARDQGQPDLGPEYHLSMSKYHGSMAPVGRTTTAEALWVLAQFDLLDATEDNHVPNGKVRNYWRPVADHLSGYECPCQDDEPAMREDKGDYVWRGITK